MDDVPRSRRQPPIRNAVALSAAIAAGSVFWLTSSSADEASDLRPASTTNVQPRSDPTQLPADVCHIRTPPR